MDQWVYPRQRISRKEYATPPVTAATVYSRIGKDFFFKFHHPELGLPDEGRIMHTGKK